MNKFLGALAALALALGLLTFGAATANASGPNRAYWAAHPCQGLHHKRLKRCEARVHRQRAAAKVGTRAEYRRLHEGMTVAQVRALFNAPMRRVSKDFAVVHVDCAPNPEDRFCDGAQALGADGREVWSVYTGRDKYSGTQCWSIEATFYDSIEHPEVFTLAKWENHSNTCTSVFAY